MKVFFIQSNIEWFFFQLGCLIKVSIFLVLLTCAVMFSIKVMFCMKVLKIIFKEKLELFVCVKGIFFLQNNIEWFFSTLMLNESWDFFSTYNVCSNVMFYMKLCKIWEIGHFCFFFFANLIVDCLMKPDFVVL